MNKRQRKRGHRNVIYQHRPKVIPAANIPHMPNPVIPDLEDDDFEYYGYPYNQKYRGGYSAYTYKKPEPKVDPAQRLMLEKQVVSHYIESIPEDCNKKVVYVMQGDGIYEKRTNRLGTFFTKIAKAEIPGLKKDIKEGWELNVPKIPASYLGIIVSFFRSICNQYSSEVFLQLFFDFETNDYILHCPKQVIGGASVRYTNDEVFEDANKVLVFEVHSHVNMSACFSSIDDSDEKADRFYGVIGKVSQFFPEIKLRLIAGGVPSEVEVEDLFDLDEEMYHIENYPKDWINNIKEEKKKVRFLPQGLCEYYGNYQPLQNNSQLYSSKNHVSSVDDMDLIDRFGDNDLLIPQGEFVLDDEEEELDGHWVEDGEKIWWVEDGEKIYYKEHGSNTLYYTSEEEDEFETLDDDELEDEVEILNHRGKRF